MITEATCRNSGSGEYPASHAPEIHVVRRQKNIVTVEMFRGFRRENLKPLALEREFSTVEEAAAFAEFCRRKIVNSRIGGLTVREFRDY